jgi:hypothetical protein
LAAVNLQYSWRITDEETYSSFDPDEMKQRGIFEKDPGSKVWWICYYDQFGKKRREKAGTKSVALKLYRKRKQQALEG